MMRKKIKQLKKLLKLRSQYNKALGISFQDYYSLSQFGAQHYVNKDVEFLGKKIKFTNPFWFLHSLDEIFVEKVYQFIPDSEPHKIIDAGANIGLSAIFLKNIFPKAQITALEPDPQIFALLQENIRSFGYEKDVHLLNAAAWINDETLEFAAEGSVGGQVMEQNESHAATIKVKSVRLRELIDSEIFFLKIDIEGAEYKVLKDIKDQLFLIKNLFIEFHVRNHEENQLDEILKWVRDAGFRYYIKEAWNNMDFPFTKKLNNNSGFQMQLNIFCYRND